MADSKVKTATVHITDDTHRNFVEGAHNGVRFKVPVGKDVQVNEGAFTALKDSGVKMNVIEPLPGEAVDEGSSAASTLEGTAIRLGGGADNNITPEGEPAELSQRPDARTNEQKEKLQLANVTDPEQGATGGSAGARGLPVDTSAAKTAKAPAKTAAKAPAKKAAAKKAAGK
jgi:hypothetical protein